MSDFVPNAFALICDRSPKDLAASEEQFLTFARRFKTDLPKPVRLHVGKKRFAREFQRKWYRKDVAEKDFSPEDFRGFYLSAQYASFVDGLVLPAVFCSEQLRPSPSEMGMVFPVHRPVACVMSAAGHVGGSKPLGSQCSAGDEFCWQLVAHVIMKEHGQIIVADTPAFWRRVFDQGLSEVLDDLDDDLVKQKDEAA